MIMKVGIIGLGQMGKGMAANLVKAGFGTTVYDIRLEPCEELRQLGATVVGSPKEVASAVDVVVSVVLDEAQTDQVFFGKEGVWEGMQDHTIIICSFISPSYVRRFAQRAKREKGVDVLDASMSGAQMGAEAGTLTFMVGGDRAVLERCRPLLEAAGKNIFYCGPIGSGQVAKIANNMLCYINIAAAVEAVTLGEKSGLDLRALLDIFNVSTGRNWSTEHWEFFMERWRDRKPGAAWWADVKDFPMFLDLAREMGVGIPITALCSQLDLCSKPTFAAGLPLAFQKEV